MLQDNIDVAAALSAYPTFESKYQGAISNPENKLGHLEGVSVLPKSNDIFKIKALGRTIEFKFSMIFKDDGRTSLGEISACLINDINEGSEIKSERKIVSFWFDKFGYIKYPTLTDNTSFNLSQEHCLGAIVETTLFKIISSEEG